MFIIKSHHFIIYSYYIEVICLITLSLIDFYKLKPEFFNFSFSSYASLFRRIVKNNKLVYKY